MTTYRHPYNRSLQPDNVTRPPLPGWLAERAERTDLTRTQRHTVEYWTRMYWATPPWLTDEHVAIMKRDHELANPAFQHRDHIVPLNHPLVCGLNVPWNLRTTSIDENLSKSNSYWPDCPDHLCPIKNATIDMFGECLDFTLCNLNRNRQLRLL